MATSCRIDPGRRAPFSDRPYIYDYTRDQGVVYMSAKTFVAIWKDERVNSLAVYLQNAGGSDALIADFRAKFSTAGQFMMMSNRDLRTWVFEVFDQTFAVTYVLRTIAVIVAIVGICLTLTTLIAERSRELGNFSRDRRKRGAVAQSFALGVGDDWIAGGDHRPRVRPLFWLSF